MRELIIDRLKAMIEVDPDYGIPRHFECNEEEHITDVEELHAMTDQQLLEVFESAIGFGG
jgi:hypothetical protein